MAISSHIAVIDQGELQQYAKPDDLYSRPNNLFVALFIGNPPMNFIEGTLEERGDTFYCTTAGGVLRLPATGIDAAGLTSNRVVLGIRPHAFDLLEDAENAITLKTDYVEHLGKENLYRCYMDKTSVRVITPVGLNRPVDRPLYVCPRFDTISVFDGESQQNISILA